MTELLHASLEDILRAIPHRPPFLLINEVRDIDGIKSGCGIMKLDPENFVFQGHFPGDPIVPGVFLIEAMAQTSGVIAALGGAAAAQAKADGYSKPTGDPPKVALVAVDKTRFKYPVRPDDEVELFVRTIHGQPGSFIWKFEGEARVDGRVACIAHFQGLQAPSGGQKT